MNPVPPLFVYCPITNGAEISQAYLADYTAAVAVPGVVGTHFHVQLGDILNDDWTIFDATMAVTPPGTKIILSLLGQTIENVAFGTVTVELTDSGAPVASTFPNIIDPLYIGAFDQAMALLEARLTAEGYAGQLFGVNMGQVSRAGIYDGQFNIPAANFNPYQDLSAAWVAAGYTPAALAAAMAQMAQSVRSRFPHAYIVYGPLDPMTTDVSAGPMGDSGVVGTQIVAAMTKAAAPVVIMNQSLGQNTPTNKGWYVTTLPSAAGLAFQTQVTIDTGKFTLANLPAAAAIAQRMGGLWVECHPNQAVAAVAALAALLSLLPLDGNAVEPGGVPLDTIPIDGSGGTTMLAYTPGVFAPLLLDAELFETALVIGPETTSGQAEVFCVRAVPDAFKVAAVADTFSVQGGRKSC